MVTNILDYSKIANNSLVITKKKVDLISDLKSSIMLQVNNIREKGTNI